MDNWDYYPSPSSSSASPSPAPPTCLPTTQLFGLQDEACSPVSPAARSTRARLASEVESASDSADNTESGRERAGGGGRPTKKARTTRDFVPPDVSGLSKREARLVKNRAAAFLSRQRKREEFEAMEVRVGQLEAENARLRSISSSRSDSRSHSPCPAKKLPSPPPETDASAPTNSNPLLALFCGLPSLFNVGAGTTQDGGGAVDVTFEATTTTNGAVRVRVVDASHPSSTDSTVAPSFTTSSASFYPTSTSASSDLYDNFLLGADLDFGFAPQEPEYVSDDRSDKRKVRISRVDGEQWEVSVC